MARSIRVEWDYSKNRVNEGARSRQRRCYVPVMGAGYIRPQTIFHSFVPFKTWCGLYARAGYIRENTVYIISQKQYTIQIHTKLEKISQF